MKKKASKHTFYCDACHSPCMIYKKGKAHRVLVCPRCGVLATNGLLSVLGGAIGSAIVPGAGTAVGAALGSGIEGLIGSKKKAPPAASGAAPTAPRMPRERKNDWVVEYALRG